MKPGSIFSSVKRKIERWAADAVNKVIFSRFERSSVDEMKNILASDVTLNSKDKEQLEKMIARLDAKKSPYLCEYEIKQFKQKDAVLRKTRVLVLLIWPLSLAAVLYFGVIPGRGNDIYWSEKPVWYFIGIVVWISVGISLWFANDDRKK